mgnify:FL=1|jgi:transporter family-2 protein
MNKYLSAFTGALVAVMILFNGVLADKFGNYTSSVIIHVVGLLTSIVALLISKEKKRDLCEKVPVYLYSAGVIGVFTVVFTNLGFLALGVSATIALGLLGQTLVSIVMDHFGWLGMKVIRFEKQKLVGLLFILIGTVIMIAFE